MILYLNIYIFFKQIVSYQILSYVLLLLLQTHGAASEHVILDLTVYNILCNVFIYYKRFISI